MERVRARGPSAWADAAEALGIPLPPGASLVGLGGAATRPRLAPTPRDEHALEGGAKLYRFHGPAGADTAASSSSSSASSSTSTPRVPLLLVPSLINRWYVLDLREGASLVEALVAPGSTSGASTGAARRRRSATSTGTTSSRGSRARRAASAARPARRSSRCSATAWAAR